MSDKNKADTRTAHILDDEVMDKMRGDFQQEALEHLDQLNLLLIQFEAEPDDARLMNQIFRSTHTIKGSTGFAGLSEISSVSRKLEEFIGAVRGNGLPVSQAVIDKLFDGIDILTDLFDAQKNDSQHDIPISQFTTGLEQLLQSMQEIPQEDAEEKPQDVAESKLTLSQVTPVATRTMYAEALDQLSALKHLVYSCATLTDDEAFAVLLSRQLYQRMASVNNSFWLIQPGRQRKAVEIARNGKQIPVQERRILEIESSELLKRVVHDMLTIWPNSDPDLNAIFPDYKKPILFPLKEDEEAYGFLALDSAESSDVDIFQFVSHFSTLMLRNSRLLRQVTAQKKELDVIMQILLKQNSNLSQLYHTELQLMEATSPEEFSDLLAKHLVSDFPIRSAAVFLQDQNQEQLHCSGTNGLPPIDDMDFRLQVDTPLHRALETGRIVNSNDYEKKFELGGQLLRDWIVVCLKGRNQTLGLLVVELDDKEITDSISILSNYSGILLENLQLHTSSGS